MKFLVMGSMKESAVTIPPSVLRKLFEATTPHLEQAAKEGKFREFYYIPGWGRFMNISEAASAEEITKNFSQNPSIGLMNLEIYPLADGAESWKTMVEAVKVAEKASA